MSIEEYFKEWLKVIDINELRKITNVLNNLYKTKSIQPHYKDVFRIFNILSLSDVKVIILGQDVYPQKDVSTGIAFGNRKETKNLSPSLEVLKEACINYEMPHGYIEFDSTLESWVNQGVLLLNSALTCYTNNPGSHTELWRPFMSRLLYNMSNLHTGCLYLLLGKQAQSYAEFINSNSNTIMVERHPAYYARMHKKMPYKVFLDINNFLDRNYGNKISWYTEIT